MLRLLQKMGASVAAKQVKTQTDVKVPQIKSSKKRALPTEGAPDEAKELDGGKGFTFLDDVDSLVAYLRKIDKDNQNLNGFVEVALFAVMHGSVTIIDKAMKTTTVDKWSTLRKLVKGQVYRAARLKPRASDVDFGGEEELPESVGSYQEAAKVQTEEDIIAVLREFAPFAEHVCVYFEKNPLTMPLASHLTVTEVTSKVMLTMMPKMAETHAKPLSADLIDAIVDLVMVALPAEFETALNETSILLPKVTQKLDELACYDKIAQLGVNSKVIAAMRLQVCLHILTVFGTFKYNFQQPEGSVEKADVVEPTIGMPAIRAAMTSFDGANFANGEFGDFCEAFLEQKDATDLKSFLNRIFNIIGEIKASLPAISPDGPLRMETELKTKLDKMGRDNLVQFIGQEGVDVAISKAVEVFPMEKAKAIDEISKKVLEKSPGFVLAKSVLHTDGVGKLDYIMKQYKEKYIVSAEAEVLVGAGASASAATSANADDAAKAGPQVMTVEAWMQKVTDEEKNSQGANGDDGGVAFTRLQREHIATAVQFQQFRRTGGNPMATQGRHIDKLLVEHDTTGVKPTFKVKQTGIGDVSLQLWGKVVEGSKASSIPKQYLLPLGVSNGVALFLDGSRAANYHSTELCLGWLVPQKQLKDVTEPVAKKGKKMEKPITHELTFDSFQLAIELDGKQYDFEYKKPSLVPSSSCPSSDGLELYRLAYDWSGDRAGEFLATKRKSTGPKVKATFALS